jgi:hypothetical protein
METNTKVYISFIYWKLQSKYNEKFHVLLKWNQTTRLNVWYIKKQSIVFVTKYLHQFPYSKTMSKNESHLPKLPLLGSPQVTINMNQN